MELLSSTCLALYKRKVASYTLIIFTNIFEVEYFFISKV